MNLRLTCSQADLLLDWYEHLLSRDFLPRVVLTKDPKPNFVRQCEGLIGRVGEQLVAAEQINGARWGRIETAILLFDGWLILLIGRWWIGRPTADGS